ncbi:MAG: hypothetical protein ABIL70_09200 [candidate division WOR-3 bacterium]
MAIINFKCNRCEIVFDFDVGEIAFELVNGRPQFEREIECPNCGKLTLDEVELTELGQSQLTELWWQNGERKQSEK